MYCGSAASELRSDERKVKPFGLGGFCAGVVCGKAGVVSELRSD